MDVGALLVLVFLVLFFGLALYRGWRGRRSQSPDGGKAIRLGDPPHVRDRDKADADGKVKQLTESSPPQVTEWGSTADEPARPETQALPPMQGATEPDLLDDALALPATPPGGMEHPREVTAPVPEPARFSAYYPKEAAPQEWLPLLAYVFRLSAASAVEADAAAALKERAADYRPVTGDSATPLAEGALVTATPELPGFQFNPPSASIAFYESWHALPFKLRATSAPPEQAANGRITFSVEGVIVADLPLSVFVTAQPSAASAATASTDPYDAIFCSYSHKDTAIVERVERAYKALGITYLRDVTTLRSGEAWNPRLLAMIDEADIFQLFWSTASAESKFVRQEWEHALSLGRGGAFVRPVYWEQPMPPAPTPLNQLHFHFDPALAETR